MMFWGHVMHLGISIALTSWVFLLISFIVAILYYYIVLAEELGCLECYRATYRGYMNRTPKWIGIPKSGKN